MTWRDRGEGGADDQSLGRPGGDWQGIRPTFDNPMTWSLPLGRIAGIAVRIHVLFLIYIVIMLLRSALPERDPALQPVGAATMAITMACLFLIVLAHEFGHCFACRWAGGEADEILMWPLGGLAFARPANHWKSHLITAAGGPAVNIVLCVAAGAMLGIVTGMWWGVAIPNPLEPLGALHDVRLDRSWPNRLLVIINDLSLVLLLFNLLPIFPLDGGRIVQALLWPRMGYRRSMMVAVRTGYVGAILLGIFGAVMNLWMLVGIALFGGVTCYLTQKQMQWTDSALGYEDDEYALSLSQRPDEAATPARGTWGQRRARRRAVREQQEAREVDRILQKIAEKGIDSLSRGERSLLKRVTQRKRQDH